LDIDNGFGARQAPRQTIILPLNNGKFGCQRVGCGGFRAALERNQRAKGPGVAKPAPVGEGRRVDALATQDRAHPTGIGGAIGLAQDAQLLLRGESPAPRPIGQLGGRRRRRRYNRRPSGTGRDGVRGCINRLGSICVS